MPYDPEIHHRRSIRLTPYDYSKPGAYFVTICAENRLSLFGDVVDDAFRPNTAGLMITSWWEDIPRRFMGCDLDAFVVMPNHMHGIVHLNDGHSPNTDDLEQGGHVGPPLPASTVVGADRRVRPVSNHRDTLKERPLLSDIIQWFKTMTTNDYIRGVRTDSWCEFQKRLWQRGYYDHIIRSDSALTRIRSYIERNPCNWANDSENPRTSPDPR